MRGQAYNWKKVMVSLSPSKEYKSDEVSNLLEPVRLTATGYTNKKARSFSKGFDGRGVPGIDIVNFYHSVIGWKRPKSLSETKHVRIGEIMETLKVYPNYGIYVSSPGTSYFLCNPNIVKKIKPNKSYIPKQNSPKPTKDYDISDLLKEAASYVRPEKRLLTRDEEIELSNKFLTAYNELGNIESKFGLPTYDIKRLIDNVDKGNRKSFSIGKNKFSMKEFIEIKRRVSDLETLTKHYTDVLIYHNTGLIAGLVKHYLPYAKSMDFYDLFDEGVIGLMRGIKKFDPGKGYKFSTYATWWIRQSIVRALIEKDRIISTPIYMNDRCLKVSKFMKYFAKKNERSPTEDELVEGTGFPAQNIKLILEVMDLGEVESLSDLIYDEGDEDWESRIVYENSSNPEDDAISKVVTDVNGKFIGKLFSNLTPRETEILKMRFGIGHDTEFTLREVGEKLNGLSRERIRQIEEAALEKLRAQSRNLNLEDYL